MVFHKKGFNAFLNKFIKGLKGKAVFLLLVLNKKEMVQSRPYQTTLCKNTQYYVHFSTSSDSPYFTLSDKKSYLAAVKNILFIQLL